MVRVVLVPTGSLAGLYFSCLARLLKSKLINRKHLLSHRFVVLSSFVNYLNIPISCELELSSEERICWVNLQGVSRLPSLHSLWIVGGGYRRVVILLNLWVQIWSHLSQSHTLPFFPNSDSHFLGLVTISSCWVQCSQGNSLDSCNKIFHRVRKIISCSVFFSWNPAHPGAETQSTTCTQDNNYLSSFFPNPVPATLSPGNEQYA